MWFSEKAAGELPRGSSVQESGNITEARNTDALRHVTAHTSTPTSSSPASDAGAARSSRVHTD